MLAALAILPVLALASPLTKRDGASIVNAISYITSNITQTNNTLNTLSTGDIPVALEVQFQSNLLIDAVNNAESVASSSADLSESDSGNVAYAVVNLEPMIFSLLDNVVAHQSIFQTVILGASADFIVEGVLQKAKSASDSFGSALVPKLTADYQAEAPTILNAIDEHFTAAINTFAS